MVKYNFYCARGKVQLLLIVIDSVIVFPGLAVAYATVFIRCCIIFCHMNNRVI
jgi:hypothetical protein